MTQTEKRLIWLDLETTGLNPDTDLIIEIATVITDNDLNILAQGPVIAVHQSDAALAKMGEWCTKQHTNSGLVDRVQASAINAAEAERLTLDFLKDWLPAGTSPLCGNGICFDRRFLCSHMTSLEAYFHYRNIDVSTLKELAARWAPGVKDGFSKKEAHLSLDDILESIAELRHYRANFLRN